MNDYRATVYAACQARDADASNSEAWSLLAWTNLEFHNVNDAIVKAARAVALAPQEPRHHRELAEVRAAVGRWSQAIESYNRALHLEPGLEAARVGFTDPVPVNVGGLHDGSGYPVRDAETSR
ncbi:hypothetical protein [Actinomadura formosensis]|uniref:hypothetical protein n=1 Tax=Actinomadura formosensis TaxID=60706 RepID=UPI003D89DB2A